MCSLATNCKYILEIHKAAFSSSKVFIPLRNRMKYSSFSQFNRVSSITSNNDSHASLLRINDDWLGSNNSAKWFISIPRLNILYSNSLHTSSQCNTKRKQNRTPIVLPKKSKVEVIPIWRGMTVSELAKAMGRDMDTLFEILLYVKNGHLYSSPSIKMNNLDTITEIVKKIGKKTKPSPNPNAEVSQKIKFIDVQKRPPPDRKKLVPRPAVITILGHVDHGKTTLLDQLRNSSVVDSEFGGITQHIGAFQFSLPEGPMITVLDTPGHAAFSAMRSRGANVTDIAVLVVAADDGVMQQTEESIQHARNAGVPIVVAINKIDKIDADVEFTKRSLINAGVQLEDDGGDVQGVPISAKKGTNINNLIEAVLLQAEILELQADPTGLVEATVVEANTEQHKGKVATCLIQRGTLKPGSFIVAGTAWARVRAMYNEHGKEVKKAPPASPVQISGWKELPSAGDFVLEVPSQKKAKDVVSGRIAMKYAAKLQADLVAIDIKTKEHDVSYKAKLEERRNLGFRFKMRRMTPREKEIPDDDTDPRVSIILKCDVDGSMEALMEVLDTYHSDFVKLTLISSGVGDVTPTDVNMAHAFKGTIYTFNVSTDRNTRDLANSLDVELVDTNIIYRLIEQLKVQVSSQLPPIPKEVFIGEAQVQEEFLINDGKKKVAVAGCRCIKGSLKRKESFRLLRGEGEDQEVIHSGPLTSMRHVKAETDSIGKDKDCGLKFADTSVRFVKGDTIQCYRIKLETQLCDWNPPGF